MSGIRDGGWRSEGKRRSAVNLPLTTAPMDYLTDKRAAQFPDRQAFERLRSLGQGIRKHALARLPELLEQLETRLAANGVIVHWAEDAAQANQIFLDIARRHGARRMVKGKSMVSEEIELNHCIAGHDIACVETDTAIDPVTSSCRPSTDRFDHRSRNDRSGNSSLRISKTCWLGRSELT